MKKLISVLIFLIPGYIIPLIWNPSLLWHYKILILMICCILIAATQPPIDMEEVEAKKNTDKNSLLIILVLSFPSIIIPVIEWAYFSTEKTGSILWTTIGFLIMSIGIGLRLWAIRTLGKAFTTTVQIVKDHQLITDGPYSWIRHPSYLGAFLAFVGGGIFLQSWIGTLVAFSCMMIAYYIRISAEEKTLNKAFGNAYLNYSRKTVRMIPFVW